MVKKLEKFPSVFEGQFITMNIPCRKERYYAYICLIPPTYKEKVKNTSPLPSNAL
jgi:hypothetical protein